MASFYDLFDKPQPERPPLTVVPEPAGDIGHYIAKVCEGITQAANGTRNDTLNRASYTLGRLVAAGQADYMTAADALTAAATAAGLDDTEIGPTIRSGLKAGENDPRALPERSSLPEVTSWIQPSASPTGTSTTTSAAGGAPTPPRSAATAEPSASSAATASDTSTAETDTPARTSWWPRAIGDVVLERAEAPLPTHLARDDGHRLFYSGKVNGLLGESESGKTWVALLAVLQALRDGQTVLYLDFEDSAKGIEGRLRLLGATDAHLARLHYANPDEALGLAQQADMAEALSLTPYQLVVVDGVNAAMTLLGLDVDSSNKDATVFTQRVLRPLANTGAAVVTIDHVPKNKDARGKGAIGAQAKRAMTRGCALSVEVVRPFGEGLTGELRLTVDKDSPGKVRGVSGGAKVAGTAHIDSSTPGRVVMRIEGPDLRSPAERGPFRPTHLMEKVSRWLETVPDGASGAVVEKEVGGNRENVRKALNVLVDEGYAARSTGPRGAVIHRSGRPFRAELTDLAHLAPTSPDLAHGRGAERPNDLASSPRPLGRGEVEVEASGPGEPSKGDDLARDEGRWWDR